MEAIMNKKMLLGLSLFLLGGNILAVEPNQSTKQSLGEKYYFICVGGLVHAKLWMMKKFLSKKDFSTQYLRHSPYFVYMVNYSEFIKYLKKSFINMFLSEQAIEIQYVSNECDFWMDAACRTNSFAAKQEIVHNLYDYLDRLEKTYSVKEIRPIRIKIDNEVKKLAVRFNVSVEVLKTVPEWVKNWKEHTQSGTASELVAPSKTQQNLASV
jgi:hypothetical protein